MVRKGNLAVICFSPYFGGMEMDAFRIAKLFSVKVDTTMIIKSGSLMEEHYRDEAVRNNIQFETIKFKYSLSPSIIAQTRKIIKTKIIKNVIFFGASEMASLFFSFLGQDINLIIRHGTTKSSPKKDIYHRLLYSNVNYHIAICKHIENNVKNIIPFGKQTKLKVIYSSLRHIPEKLPEPHYHDKPTITVLHVGRITDGKGQIDAIKACDVLYNSDISFKLILLGELDPNYQEVFNMSLTDLPYRSSIIFPGYTDAVSEYYKSADIFIFPSKGEGLSNSFIEALTYGLICISYNNTSFPELAELGFDFFMALNGDINDLRQCLSKAVKYLKNHKTPILQNTKLAQNIFSRNKEMKELLQILE